MTKKSAPTPAKGLTVLSTQDVFRFDCHSKLDCFTRCCRDITIFLTPYDIVRMKNALQLSSGAFLAQYTVTMIADTGLPVVILKMADDDRKSCPFVTPQGCAIYQDRPWACRIYPLQPESTKSTEKSRQNVLFGDGYPFLSRPGTRPIPSRCTTGSRNKIFQSITKWRPCLKKSTPTNA